MTYGLTLDEVRATQQPKMLPTSWGSMASLTEMPQFAMYRLAVRPGASQPLHFYGCDYQMFVEEGEVLVRTIDSGGEAQSGIVQAGKILPLPQFLIHGFASTSGAVIYLFGPRSAAEIDPHLAETEEAALTAYRSLIKEQLRLIGQPTTDLREKYWGRIETILSQDIAAKRIFVRAGGQSSLEYHVEKSESYYVHSGLLRVGLRIGRAENHSIVLKAGESYDVRPGVMHMRMGIEDTVIIEVSTRDLDSDSYLVEDGQTYRHIDVNQPRSHTI